MNRVLHLAVGWLAVAGTLATGSPHISCVCPNGNLKAFCFGIASNHGGCCCGGGTCCANDDGKSRGDTNQAPVQKSEQCCCANKAKSRADESSKPHLKDDSPCCKKTWKQGAITGAPQPDTTAKSERVVLLLSAPTCHVPTANDVPRLLSWQNHQIPPPTNLIVTLQHFII